MMSTSFRIFENKMVIPWETLIASQGLEFEVKWISNCEYKNAYCECYIKVQINFSWHNENIQINFSWHDEKVYCESYTKLGFDTNTHKIGAKILNFRFK